MNWASTLPPSKPIVDKTRNKGPYQSASPLIWNEKANNCAPYYQKNKSPFRYNLQSTYTCMDVRIFTKCLLFDDMYLQVISRGVYSHNVTGK